VQHTTLEIPHACSVSALMFVNCASLHPCCGADIQLPMFASTHYVSDALMQMCTYDALTHFMYAALQSCTSDQARSLGHGIAHVAEGKGNPLRNLSNG
jgi:hypothetical protein